MFVSFNEKNGDVLICGDHRFFVFREKNSTPFVIPAQCPHRGGPLSMGEFDECSGRLSCPWHGYSWTLKKLRSWGLPAFSIRGQWTVQLPRGIDTRNLVVVGGQV